MRRLSALGIDMGRLSALDQLALVGDHGRGALTFAPATTPAADAGMIDLAALATCSPISAGRRAGLAGNREDHTRQHGYLMDDAGDWHLAPAYDLTFSDGPSGEHYLAVAGEGAMPTHDNVDRVARTHGISPKTVAAIVDRVAGWDAAARDVGCDTTALVAARLATIRAAFGG